MIGAPDTAAAPRAPLLSFFSALRLRRSPLAVRSPVLTDVGHPPAGTTEHRPGQRDQLARQPYARRSLASTRHGSGSACPTSRQVPKMRVKNQTNALRPEMLAHEVSQMGHCYPPESGITRTPIRAHLEHSRGAFSARRRAVTGSATITSGSARHRCRLRHIICDRLCLDNATATQFCNHT